MDKTASLALRFTESLAHPESGRAKNFREWIAPFARPRETLPPAPPDEDYARSRDGLDEIFLWWIADDSVVGVPVSVSDPSYPLDMSVGYVIPLSALPAMPRRAA